MNHDNLKKIISEPRPVCKGQNKNKICCHNSRSVKNKTFVLSDYVISNDFDIIAVTETWLGGPGDKACIAELVPSGYKMFLVKVGVVK